MEALTWKQQAVLLKLIELSRTIGPPMASHLQEKMGTRVARELSELKLKGYAAQVHERGPWKPTKTPEGEPVALALLDGEMAFRLNYVRSLTDEDREEMRRPATGDVMGKLRAHIEKLQAQTKNS